MVSGPQHAKLWGAPDALAARFMVGPKPEDSDGQRIPANRYRWVYAHPHALGRARGLGARWVFWQGRRCDQWCTRRGHCVRRTRLRALADGQLLPGAGVAHRPRWVWGVDWLLGPCHQGRPRRGELWWCTGARGLCDFAHGACGQRLDHGAADDVGELSVGRGEPAAIWAAGRRSPWAPARVTWRRCARCSRGHRRTPTR